MLGLVGLVFAVAVAFGATGCSNESTPATGSTPPPAPASVPGVSGPPAPRSLRPMDTVTLAFANREAIEVALRRTHGRIEGPRGAAAALGINPHTLRARMRKLGLDWARFREE